MGEGRGMGAMPSCLFANAADGGNFRGTAVGLRLALAES